MRMDPKLYDIPELSILNWTLPGFGWSHEMSKVVPLPCALGCRTPIAKFGL